MVELHGPCPESRIPFLLRPESLIQAAPQNRLTRIHVEDIASAIQMGRGNTTSSNKQYAVG